MQGFHGQAHGLEGSDRAKGLASCRAQAYAKTGFVRCNSEPLTRSVFSRSAKGLRSCRVSHTHTPVGSVLCNSEPHAHSANQIQGAHPKI
eukprot:361684-Chlamydomonas_euryale.AAC.1